MADHDGSERWVSTQQPNLLATTGSVPIDDILMPGEVVGGRYEIVDVLGEGGFGVVYRARQSELGRDVAIKTLRRSLIEYEEAAQRFRREAMLARHLTHPHTIRLYDFGQTDNGTLYICMEYLDGETLEERIEREGRVSLDHVLHIATQIAKSLTEAHQNGIVHRDLKPSNVFLCEVAGEGDFVKVLDFGIAKITQPWDEGGGWSDKLTRTGTAFGSPAYMSPEQVRGIGITAASDVYSFGLIVLEALTGQQVVDGNSPFDVAVKQASPQPIPIPPWIEKSPLGALLRKSLAKESQKRYPDASALLDDLEKIDDQAVQKYAQSLTQPVKFNELLEEAYSYNPSDEPSEPKKETRGSRAWMIVALAILLVGAAIVAMLALNRPPSAVPTVAPSDAPTRPSGEQAASPGDAARERGGAPTIAISQATGAVHGAVVEQRFPRLPLGVPASRLPIPLTPRASLLNPGFVLVNTRNVILAAPVADRLASAQISVADTRGLAMTRGVLIGSIAGARRLKNVVLKFDSRPRGALVSRLSDGVRVGTAPLELSVVKSGRHETYRFESKGYRPYDLEVSHNEAYNGFALLEKGGKGKRGRGKSRRRGPTPGVMLPD